MPQSPEQDTPLHMRHFLSSDLPRRQNPQVSRQSAARNARSRSMHVAVHVEDFAKEGQAQSAAQDKKL